MDPGRYVEFRGLWEPPPSDAPGTPPAVAAPPRGEWGFLLFTGYEYSDPFDQEDWPNRVIPAGAVVAETSRAYGEDQAASGDWSGPGFLFSYQLLDVHFFGQPPP